MLSSQFFCKWETVLKSRIHSKKKRPSREVQAYTAPPWKTTAQSLWSTAWAGVGPVCHLGWSHPAQLAAPPPKPGVLPTPWPPRNAQETTQPLFVLVVDLCLKDLSSSAPHASPPQLSSLGRQGVGKSIPPSDPPWTQQASLALTLGTRPGHFDGVSGQSLGQFPSFSARGFIACSSQGFLDLELTI